MFTQAELLDAIDEICKGKHSIQNCEKLAAVYTVLDHIEPKSLQTQGYSYEVKDVQETFGQYGDSEFLKTISGKSIKESLDVINEMVDAVAVFNPKLHKAFLSRLSSLGDKIIK